MEKRDVPAMPLSAEDLAEIGRAIDANRVKRGAAPGCVVMKGGVVTLEPGAGR